MRLEELATELGHLALRDAFPTAGAVENTSTGTQPQPPQHAMPTVARWPQVVGASGPDERPEFASKAHRGHRAGHCLIGACGHAPAVDVALDRRCVGVRRRRIFRELTGSRRSLPAVSPAARSPPAAPPACRWVRPRRAVSGRAGRSQPRWNPPPTLDEPRFPDCRSHWTSAKIRQDPAKAIVPKRRHRSMWPSCARRVLSGFSLPQAADSRG